MAINGLRVTLALALVALTCSVVARLGHPLFKVKKLTLQEIAEDPI